MIEIAIKMITAAETYDVRHPVLRKNRPLSSCGMEGDDNSSTIHWGAYSENALVGVVSLFSTPDHFKTKICKQVRGMAVLPSYRGKGIGKQLLKNLEDFAQKNRTNYLWMNAREKSIAFYQHLGYLKKGEMFEIEPIGTHRYLYKLLP